MRVTARIRRKSRAYWKHGKHKGVQSALLAMKRDVKQKPKPKLFSSPIEAVRDAERKRRKP